MQSSAWHHSDSLARNSEEEEEEAAEAEKERRGLLRQPTRRRNSGTAASPGFPPARRRGRSSARVRFCPACDPRGRGHLWLQCQRKSGRPGKACTYGKLTSNTAVTRQRQDICLLYARICVGKVIRIRAFAAVVSTLGCPPARFTLFKSRGSAARHNATCCRGLARSPCVNQISSTVTLLQ